MKATIEKGDLKIDVQELVQALDAETRKVIAQFLCADELLIQAVLECVVDGHYFTDDEQGPWWFDHRTVLALQEKLKPLMGEAAKNALDEALRQRDYEKKQRERVDRWAWRMYHRWPREHLRERPELPLRDEECQP